MVQILTKGRLLLLIVIAVFAITIDSNAMRAFSYNEKLQLKPSPTFVFEDLVLTYKNITDEALYFEVTARDANPQKIKPLELKWEYNVEPQNYGVEFKINDKKFYFTAAHDKTFTVYDRPGFEEYLKQESKKIAPSDMPMFNRLIKKYGIQF